MPAEPGRSGRSDASDFVTAGLWRRDAPAAGTQVLIQRNGNLSTDVTDHIHPDNHGDLRPRGTDHRPRHRRHRRGGRRPGTALARAGRRDPRSERDAGTDDALASRARRSGGQLTTSSSRSCFRTGPMAAFPSSPSQPGRTLPTRSRPRWRNPGCAPGSPAPQASSLTGVPCEPEITPRRRPPSIF